MCTRGTTCTSKSNATMEFGCSLTLKEKRLSSGYSKKLKKTKPLAHSMIFRVGAFLHDSSLEQAKAPRVTTNSSLGRLFQVGASLTRLRASNKTNYTWATIHCTQMPRKVSV